MKASYHSAETYRVMFQDCAPCGQIHLHRLMDYAQDCDDRNCLLLDIDSKSLREKNACWIMIGNSLHFNAPRPRAGDLLIVDSWSIGLDGIRFYRGNKYYRNQVSDHSLIGTAISEWILARADNHKPLRPAQVLDLAEFAAMSDPLAANKFEIPKLKAEIDYLSAPSRFDYLAGLGDVDMNTHLHNTHYSRLALDAASRLLQLDPHRQTLLLKSFHIAYKAEVDYGQTLELAADFDSAEPSSIKVEGMLGQDGTTSFLAKLNYEITDHVLEDKPV